MRWLCLTIMVVLLVDRWESAAMSLDDLATQIKGFEDNSFQFIKMLANIHESISQAETRLTVIDQEMIPAFEQTNAGRLKVAEMLDVQLKQLMQEIDRLSGTSNEALTLASSTAGEIDSLTGGLDGLEVSNQNLEGDLDVLEEAVQILSADSGLSDVQTSLASFITDNDDLTNSVKTKGCVYNTEVVPFETGYVNMALATLTDIDSLSHSVVGLRADVDCSGATDLSNLIYNVEVDNIAGTSFTFEVTTNNSNTITGRELYVRYAACQKD